MTLLNTVTVLGTGAPELQSFPLCLEVDIIYDLGWPWVVFPIIFWVVYPSASNSLFIYVLMHQYSVEYLRGMLSILGALPLWSPLICSTPASEQQWLGFFRFLALLLLVLWSSYSRQEIRWPFIHHICVSPRLIPVPHKFLLVQWPMLPMTMLRILL